MSLQHILLGCLAQPASGYDLQKEIEGSLSHFWSVHLPQIYPTLRRMETEKLVASKMEKSAAGPARRVYRRTAAGDKALVDWLLEGPMFSSERKQYLAQIYFLDEIGDLDKALTFLEDLQSIMEARLEALSSIELLWREEFGSNYPDNLPTDGFFRHLTFDLGMEVAATYVDWCARSVKRLKKRMKKGAAKK